MDTENVKMFNLIKQEIGGRIYFSKKGFVL